jgi:hypothetical protein
MSTTQIQQELKLVIKQGDSRLLKMLYAVAKEYENENYTLPGKAMSSSELKQRIKAAKGRIKSGQFTSQSDLEREINEW